MSKTILGIGVVMVAAAAGIVGCALLYAAVIGLSLLVSASDGSEAPSLWQRAWQFGITFGLLSGAHWGLGGSRHQVGDDRRAMLVVKAMTVALVVLGLGLALTGGRWSSMFGGVGGPGAILVVAWMALTQIVSKAADKRAPTGRPAGAR